MPNNIFLYPYQNYSKSVHALRKAVPNCRVIRTEGSKYKHNRDKLIINWGSSSMTVTEHQKNGPVLNPTSAVKLCANKLRFFQAMEKGGVSIPKFTTDPDVAAGWIAAGEVVMGRTTLNGHSGQGIVFSDEDDVVNNPEVKLYVSYVKKKDEYRVHIFRGRVIDTQQKKLRTEDNEGQPVQKEFVNFRVRSYNNGFVFARQDIIVPRTVHEEALKAFHSIPNLDFGAFDVIFNQHHNQAYVLECNTAPGLEGTTLDNYVREISRAAAYL